MEPLDHKEFYVSWEDMHRTSRQLASMLLKEGRKYRAIIAVSRGGLVPAAILARELNIRLVDTICISSYDHDNQRGLEIIKDVLDDAEDILIIDDLVDTGNTAKVIKDKFPNAKFITVYAKPKGKPLVDMYVTDVEQDTWIHLPWDLVMKYEDPLVDRKAK
jgi:xanthine phosphoribosyltransferase